MRARLNRSARGPARARRFLFFVPLALLWLVPVLVFVALVPHAASAEQAALASTVPATTQAGERVQDLRRAVNLTVDVEPGPTVLSPAAGTVTGVQVEVGDRVRTGSRLVSVDGSAVYAVVGGTPLFRTVVARDSGGDVASVCALLHALDLYAHKTCASADSQVVAAIDAFRTDAGLTPNGTFDASFAAYVPAGTGRVTAVPVSTGEHVDIGSALVETAATPTGVTIEPGDGGTLAALQGAPLTLQLGSTDVDLESTDIADDQVAPLAEELAVRAGAGDVAVGASPGETAPGLTYTGALVRLRDPQQVAAVPGSAVYVTAGGKACVFVASDRPADDEARVLTAPQALFGEPGLVAVDHDLAGQSVVTDITVLPAAVLARCA